MEKRSKGKSERKRKRNGGMMRLRHKGRRDKKIRG